MARVTGMATLLGFAAITMWALLALFTDLSGSVPPFQLNAMAFALATLVGAAAVVMRGSAGTLLRLPGRVWFTGVAGLFGYHFLYFTALRNAPAVEASLIAYLWPLLIVLGSALLPGERLRWFHVTGALTGLAGAVMLITRDGFASIDTRYLAGYVAAIGCALTWSTYSLVSRRFSTVSSDAVTGFCAATAILSLACHLVFETTRWPETAGQWLAVAGLGLMPVGAAFYLWDHGVKHGNIQLLGVASYAAPLLSTLVLIAAGRAEATGSVLVACLLITAGAFLAAIDVLGLGSRRRRAA